MWKEYVCNCKAAVLTDRIAKICGLRLNECSNWFYGHLTCFSRKHMEACSLVFLDIDGTLRDSNHRIMPQTKQILNRLEQRGIPIILCSASSPGGVETVERQADLHSPIVCCV